MKPVPRLRPHLNLGLWQRQRIRQGFVFSFVLAVGMALVLSTLREQQAALPNWSSLSRPAWSQTLSEARLEGKLCVVRFYTDYCYPCEAWESRLQQDHKLFELLEAAYVLYEIDPWHTFNGGRELAERYHITTYPTLLITDADGQELARYSALEGPSTLRNALVAKAHASPSHYFNPDVESLPPMQPVFGLSLGNKDSYEEARTWASQEALGWAKGVYIEPHGTGYRLVLGSFATKQEAKVTQHFLEVWEQRKTRLTPLSPDGHAYDF
ncbi:MAG: hypothetical protein D6722_22790 [Bacteroidetes bacterium]|nr:MAG: hypothetical protein D6722_22790 [Bacteroidota bacterium]